MNARLALAAGVALVLVGAFAAGRYTAPTKTVEKVRTVEVVKEVTTKQKEETRREDESTRVREITKWKVHYVRHPDGSVERTAESETGHSAATETKREEAKREVEIKYVDRFREVERLKVVETEKAAWSLGARASFASGPRTIYGGEASRRLIGPLWGTVVASTAKEVGVGVRFEW